MDLAIVASPYKTPEEAEEFIEKLMNTRRFMRGEDKVPEKLDVAAFESFKRQVMEDSKLLGAK